MLNLVGAAAAGFALAAASGWVIARGARVLSYRVLFRTSEILLLLIAGSLLAAGIDRMIRGTFQCWGTANDLIGHDDIEGCGAGGGEGFLAPRRLRGAPLLPRHPGALRAAARGVLSAGRG